MAGMNQATLIGHLGRDPEIKTLQNGTTVANFSVATSESYTDKTTGQKVEQTEWHNIVVWGKQAENCAKYLSKGKQVAVQGKLRTKSWEKDGHKNYRTEIHADTVQFLGSSASSGNGRAAEAPAMAVAATPNFTAGNPEDIPF